MNKKILIGIIIFLSTILLVSGGYFGIIKYIDYKNTQNVEEINSLVEKEESREVCEKILDFDLEDAQGNSKFKKEKYDNYHISCNKKYNFKFIEQNLKNCKNIISGNKGEYKKDYIILDDFSDIQKQCSEKYLKISFSTGSFFDVNNDFKSSINLEFSMPFFTDIGKLASEEYIENRIEAKKRLISLLDILPNVQINVDDIVLYPKKGIINLSLQPLTEYKITLKAFKTKNLDLETKHKVFKFTTPENKFLGIQLVGNPVSLYMDSKAPEFEVIKYNLSDKEKTTLKICRIDNENYAKIEILRGRKEAKKEMEQFFIEGIDELDTYKCFKKVVSLDNKNVLPLSPKGEIEGGQTMEKNLLVRQKINLETEIGDPARSGLYFVTFENKEDRNINNNLQFPIFFGIIDSHITMKISKNGEGYFFVNDFEGKPLADQEIRVYINKFVDHANKYDRVLKKRITTYNSPLEKSVLGKEILLGKTGSDGTLRVDLKDKIEGAFEKTFSAAWNYRYSGVNESFFVTSASKTHLTYNHSHWNAGIAPWNFGYKIDSGWYYGDEDGDQSTPNLSSWGREIKKYYSHVYTDRVLYLPGEKVHIKSVIRKSTDLSIPKNKEFRIIVKDSKQKEILNSKLKLSDFGSISDTLQLSKNAPLGSYLVIVKDKNGEYSRTSFSVEVFKNPKFKNDISLQVEGLNGEDVQVTKSAKKTKWGEKIYEGKFKINAKISSKYYSGGIPKNASYSYKVYKQYYYDNSYWDDCYFGCYWEPNKEFYTQGKGNLDANGKADISINVDFQSSYDDYKYIVEVTVIDKLGDKISGSNSIIARLPENLKSWNQKADLQFQTKSKFYRQGENITIKGGLSVGKWLPEYDNKYLFVIKKKNYITKYIDDVRGYKRPVNVVEEKLEKVMLINSSNFKVTNDGKLELDFIAEQTGEYIFEYAKINSGYLANYPDIENLKNLIKQFNTKKKLKIHRGLQNYIGAQKDYEKLNFIVNTCSDSKEKCKRSNISKKLFCKTRQYISGEVIIKDTCGDKNTFSLDQTIDLDNLLDQSKKYISVLFYGDINAENPIASDNKVRVLSEKVSYHLGETAKILVRLPFNKGKILWTIEKQGVIKKEYIDVNSNMFFKEVLVDDTFVPNAYIGIVAIETPPLTPPSQGGGKINIPEYKVGYTEIVVDKTDKKSNVRISTNKKVYKPREKVTLNISNILKNKAGKQAELTIMVVDDSLISLMGNVDLNILEKFYKKLPFQIQTSLTNLAMLKNYYFSRPGIVGGSGFGNFKGGDSAVSSRTIFKNTAYYNPNVITDEFGNAQVEFELPDNLTNFRIMVSANSKDNFFGFASHNIEVRKNVVIEDKTPLIYRAGDRTEIGAQIFNHTDKEIGFSINFNSKDIQVNKAEKFVMVGANSSQVVQFWTQGKIDKNKDISYTISALGDSAENSDKLEKIIENKEFPALKSVFVKGGLAKLQQKQNFKIEIPENTDLEKSKVKISFSNNVLEGVQKTLKSLLVYPYGCIEQTISSTYPNAVLLSFGDIFPNTLSLEKAQENLQSGIERIQSMQLADGGFAYWQGDSHSNLHITPYALRRLLDMKELGAKVPNNMITNAKKYLEKNFSNITQNIDATETFYAFAKLGEGELAYNRLLKNVDKLKFTRHEWIVYTYGLIEWDKEGNKEVIDRNIERIIKKLQRPSQSYWSARSDKALFTSMLIDYGYNQDIVTQYIQELYSIDWSNYYYSTTAKNNAFIAFAKYIKKYGNNSLSNFAFSIGAIHNRDKRFNLGGPQPNIITREFRLKDIIQYKENHIELTTYILSGRSIFTNLTLEIYPKDKLKMSAVSNGINVERKIYKVLDENKLSDCTAIYSWRSKKANCSKIVKEVLDGKYEKGSLYKIGIKVSFENDKQRENIALEDYIPSSFRIINSKFKTESISKTKGNKRSWAWDHVESLKDRIFANASNAWGQDLYFEYMVIPEFAGEFIYPPVSAYMMYDGDIKAHSKFERIIVE